jgi:hypothetical protein
MRLPEQNHARTEVFQNLLRSPQRIGRAFRLHKDDLVRQYAHGRQRQRIRNVRRLYQNYFSLICPKNGFQDPKLTGPSSPHMHFR